MTHTTQTQKGYDVSRRNEKPYGWGVSAPEIEGPEGHLERFAVIGEIAAEVAHELRNALQIVSANVYLARQNPTESEPFLLKIERGTRVAQGIVDDLMALARGEQVRTEPIAVESLLFAGREMLPPASAAMSDSLSPPGLNVRVHPGLAARLLHVLYENAIKASSPRKPRITTRVERVGPNVVLQISDDGPGVPPAIAETLFQPLVSMRPGGSGLGLALARRIVVAHGGTIRLEGKSTFVIELPA